MSDDDKPRNKKSKSSISKKAAAAQVDSDSENENSRPAKKKSKQASEVPVAESQVDSRATEASAVAIAPISFPAISDEDMNDALDQTMENLAYDGMASKSSKSKSNKRKKPEKPKPESSDDSSDSSDEEKKPSKHSKKKKPSKKKASKSDSDSDSGGDSSDSGSDDEAPPAAASSSSKSKPVTKKKKQGSDSDSDASGSDDSSSDDDDEQGAFVLSKPNQSVQTSYKQPDLADFLNPNVTMRSFSLKHRLFVHYSEIEIKKHLKLVCSKPKDGYTRLFPRVNCNRDQRFDFSGGSRFQTVGYNEFMCISPFMVANWPEMWPFGNLNSKNRPPEKPYMAKLNCPLTNMSYAQAFEADRESIGTVDRDSDQFLSQWWYMFDKWAVKEAWKRHGDIFTNRTKILMKKINEDLDTQQTEYEMQKKKWKKTEEGPKPKAPKKDSKDIEKKLRQSFLSSGIKKMVASKEGLLTLYTSSPLLKNVTKKEQDMNAPYTPINQWFREMFVNPPKYEDKSTNPSTFKDGIPRKAVQLPFFAAITHRQAKEQHEKGIKRVVGWRLIPPQDAFIGPNDVIAVGEKVEPYDSPTGSGFRTVPVCFFWLGERNKLNEELQPLPDVDPTTYFVIAQEYTRTRDNYKPGTVEQPQPQPQYSEQDNE